MNCEECKNRLEDFFLGELSGSDEDRMQCHIVECHDCESQWRDYESIRKFGLNLGQEILPSGFITTQIMKAAEEKITKQPGFITQFFASFFKPAFASMYLLILVTGIAWYAIQNQSLKDQILHDEAKPRSEGTVMKELAAPNNNSEPKEEKIIESHNAPGDLTPPLLFQ